MSMLSRSLIDRRQWLAAAGATLALSTLGCERGPESSAGESNSKPSAGLGVDDSILELTLQWLWNRQLNSVARARYSKRVHTTHQPGRAPPEFDGSWKSSTYALLKSGRTLTPFLLNALRGVRDESLPCGANWKEAYAFVRGSVNSSGCVAGGADDIVEYPNYATALALQSLVAAPSEYLPTDLRALMVKYLVGQQCDEAAGFAESDAAYGAFGFGGAKPVGGSPGHLDIAHTRHALEALRAAGHDDRATYRRAERFLRLLQKHPTEDRSQPDPEGRNRTQTSKPPYDGGFYFSPVVLAANKGGVAHYEGRDYFRSYATATCDGILALLACGVPRDDERIAAARQWLLQHPELDYPGGIPTDANENWRAAVRFYHFAVRAECYAALQWPGEWRKELRRILAGLQQPDGSFENREGSLMKEDDPLVCTGLAVIALSR